MYGNLTVSKVGFRDAWAGKTWHQHKLAILESVKERNKKQKKGGKTDLASEI